MSKIQFPRYPARKSGWRQLSRLEKVLIVLAAMALAIVMIIVWGLIIMLSFDGAELNWSYKRCLWLAWLLVMVRESLYQVMKSAVRNA